MKKLKYIELFGGIGACTEALKEVDIDKELVDYVEIDKYAVKSFTAMNNTNFEPQDITKWDKDIEVDFIMHGSPCTSYSIAGKQTGGNEGSGTKSSLMWETVRIIEKLKPKFVLWENVSNILSKKHRHNFDKYIERLEELGYNSYYEVLNSKDFSIPQNRKRLFCLSVKKEINNDFKFPEPQELKLRLKDMLEDKVDEKYYLSNEKTKSLIEQLKPKEYDCIDTKMPKNSKSELSKTILASCYKEPLQVVEPKINQIGMLDIKGNEQIRRVYGSNGISPTLNTMQGGNRQPKILEEPKIIKVGQLDSSFEQSGRVHSTEGISPTVMGNSHGKTTGGYNATKILEEFRIRKLSPLECWRLQGFSDEQFRKAEKVCSSTQLYKQSGNSITVNVLVEIFKQMIKYGYLEV